ncbi:MAG: 50S ribosomal protein L6 [Candidatus Marinimicrobia bacterium]|nr:50S ribosomal protein L6 [Candidatus Neomarinimicrobiota bacterium]|tara:strand:+ start:267 stop:803 length:537 start_codon:yes stop_codon:yes gene_type:complete
MSRIGNNPIVLSDDVKVELNDKVVTVSGKKGSLSWTVHPSITILVKENNILFERIDESALSRSLHGTTRQIVNNMVIGVSDGFKKELEIVGVGYQASMQGDRMQLQIGYSHDIFFDLPEGVKATADRTLITIEGIDKQLVGSVASKIRSFRSPEPYKGKGIRYKDEYIRIKQGKTVGE